MPRRTDGRTDGRTEEGKSGVASAPSYTTGAYVHTCPMNQATLARSRLRGWTTGSARRRASEKKSDIGCRTKNGRRTSWETPSMNQLHPRRLFRRTETRMKRDKEIQPRPTKLQSDLPTRHHTMHGEMELSLPAESGCTSAQPPNPGATLSPPRHLHGLPVSDSLSHGVVIKNLSS